MHAESRGSREDRAAFRSVPTQNLVRILSGELAIPGSAPAPRARPAPRPRLTGWKRVLNILGLYGW